MRVQATDSFYTLHLDRCSQERDFAMSNFWEYLRTSKLVCELSRYQERVLSDAHSWMVASVFCTAGCPRIRSWLHGKND